MEHLGADGPCSSDVTTAETCTMSRAGCSLLAVIALSSTHRMVDTVPTAWGVAMSETEMFAFAQSSVRR